MRPARSPGQHARGGAVRMDVHGLRDLKEQLIQLGELGDINAIGRAGRKAMAIVADEAQETVARQSTDPGSRHKGHLRDAIRVAVKRPKRGGIVASIGIVTTYRRITDEVAVYGSEGELLAFEKVKTGFGAGWRWHWIEFGTAHSAPEPFLGPAFNGNINTVVGTFRRELEAEIVKLRKKAARRRR